MPARDYFRAHERRRVDFPGTLRVHDGTPPGGSGSSSAAVQQDVKVRDLGLGGAGIEIQEGSAPSPIDREVAVTIELLAPTLWDPIVLRGKIAWIKRSGQGRSARAGVRFEHRESAVLQRLFQFLGAQRDEV